MNGTDGTDDQINPIEARNRWCYQTSDIYNSCSNELIYSFTTPSYLRHTAQQLLTKSHKIIQNRIFRYMSHLHISQSFFINHSFYNYSPWQSRTSWMLFNLSFRETSQLLLLCEFFFFFQSCSKSLSKYYLLWIIIC